jgi:glycosyltransferase involved in cell wall biosynthesis
VGGIEYVAEAWARQLTNFGHEVIVITSTQHSAKDIFPFVVLRNISFFKKWKLYRSSDMVLQFNISLKEWPAIWLSSTPSVVSHHSSFYFSDGTPTSFAKLKNWIVSSIVQKNITCSNFISSYIKVPSTVIPNPYRDQLFLTTTSNLKKKRIVYLGRLVSDKGCEILVKAFAKIERLQSEVELFIVGDGPEKDKLLNLVKLNSIQSKVFFLGEKQGDELVKILQESKIMVIPSLWKEPFGIVALEGIACGCQVLASNIGGLPEAVGVCGRLFEPGNVNELAQLLEESLISDNLVLPSQADIQKHLMKHTEFSSAKALEEALQKIN